MSLLQKATRQRMFAKFGFLGLPASGKTFTACHLAAGIAVRTGKKKPVAFYDSEGGSDYVQHLFEKAGVELLVVKSRSFSDLILAMKEAQESCCALVIDSITHPWIEVCESYLAKVNEERLAKGWKKVDRMEFQHWNYLKKLWRTQFTEPYLNSPLHIFMCGRLGYEYEYQEKDGKKELVKGDIKMKAEAELGYEPSVLIEMERVFDEDGKMHHRAIVLKDRFDLLNGKIFIDPKFSDFSPIWEHIQLGKETLPIGIAVDTNRSSSEMLESPPIPDDNRKMQKKILNEEIDSLLLSAFPGQTAKEKKIRVDLLQVAFDTSSETALSVMEPHALKYGKDVLAFLLMELTRAVENKEEVPIGPDLIPWLKNIKKRYVAEEELPEFASEEKPAQAA